MILHTGNEQGEGLGFTKDLEYLGIRGAALQE
jgi:hypothetical protein